MRRPSGQRVYSILRLLKQIDGRLGSAVLRLSEACLLCQRQPRPHDQGDDEKKEQGGAIGYVYDYS